MQRGRRKGRVSCTGFLVGSLCDLLCMCACAFECLQVRHCMDLVKNSICMYICNLYIYVCTDYMCL